YLNETYFLTEPDWKDQLQVRFLPADSIAIALFSDGIEQMVLDGTLTPHEPFFGPLFACASKTSDSLQASGQLERFLLSDKIQSHTHDDVSLIVAVRPDDLRI